MVVTATIETTFVGPTKVVSIVAVTTILWVTSTMSCIYIFS